MRSPWWMGTLLLAGLLPLVSPTVTSVAIQREFDRHTGSDEARFEGIKEAQESSSQRIRDDLRSLGEKVEVNGNRISVLETKTKANEQRLDKIEERLFAMMLLLIGGLLTLGVNTIFTIKTHQAIRDQREWDGQDRRRREE